MSFILDALKKSESDRQRKNRPDNAHVATGSDDKPASNWLLIIGALLLVNIIVLAVVFLKPDQADSDAAPTSVVADDAFTEETPSSFPDRVASAKNSPPDRGATSSTTPAAEVPVALESKPANKVVSGSSVPSTVSTAYRTFNDVRVDGSVRLDDLHLDIHVYSATPAERFVFINMSKYKENATLDEGPVVAEIVPEGVILDHLGTRFLLPRE